MKRHWSCHFTPLLANIAIVTKQTELHATVFYSRHPTCDIRHLCPAAQLPRCASKWMSNLPTTYEVPTYLGETPSSYRRSTRCPKAGMKYHSSIAIFAPTRRASLFFTPILDSSLRLNFCIYPSQSYLHQSCTGCRRQEGAMRLNHLGT